MMKTNINIKTFNELYQDPAELKEFISDLVCNMAKNGELASYDVISSDAVLTYLTSFNYSSNNLYFKYSTLSSITLRNLERIDSVDYSFFRSLIKLADFPSLTAFTNYPFSTFAYSCISSFNAPQLKNVANSTFLNTPISQVNLDNCTLIDTAAFMFDDWYYNKDIYGKEYDPSLYDIRLPKVEKLEEAAFFGQIHLSSIYAPAVSSIESFAFAGTNLKDFSFAYNAKELAVDSFSILPYQETDLTLNLTKAERILLTYDTISYHEYEEKNPPWARVCDYSVTLKLPNVTDIESGAFSSFNHNSGLQSTSYYATLKKIDFTGNKNFTYANDLNYRVEWGIDRYYGDVEIVYDDIPTELIATTTDETYSINSYKWSGNITCDVTINMNTFPPEVIVGSVYQNGTKMTTSGKSIKNTEFKTLSGYSKCRCVEIGKNGFSYCSKIEEIDIPTLTCVNENSFTYSGLQTFKSKNLKTICNNAFAGCTSLTSLYIPNISTIQSDAFIGCTSRLYIDISNSKYSSVEGNDYYVGSYTSGWGIQHANITCKDGTYVV